MTHCLHVYCERLIGCVLGHGHDGRCSLTQPKVTVTSSSPSANDPLVYWVTPSKVPDCYYLSREKPEPMLPNDNTSSVLTDAHKLWVEMGKDIRRAQA